MTTPIGESITSNQMTGREQLAQILLPTTEIGGSVSIANTIRTDTENWNEPTIQPTIVHLKQVTVAGHSDRNHFPISILNGFIDIPRSGQNIDNRTGMNQQGPIVTTIPESIGAKNCNTFNSVMKISDITYRELACNGKIKGES